MRRGSAPSLERYDGASGNPLSNDCTAPRSGSKRQNQFPTTPIAKATKRAILIAIAIPVFTSQLERAREATDAANIRAKYAEVMVAVLDNKVNSMSESDRQVKLEQQQEDWQNTELSNGMIKLVGNSAWIVNKPQAGGNATLSWAPGTNTSGDTAGVEGHITITF